jgi:hypothetical protein
MNFDDTEAFERFPRDAWVYNKLSLYQKLGYRAAPHGIIPAEFPVISKPMVNLWGLALGVDRWCSPADIKYQAGYLWMEEFSGAWMSYDIDFDTGVVWTAQAITDTVWQGTPSGWHVKPQTVADLPSDVVSKIASLNLSTSKINVETIGGNITEVHLRWSHEISQWYDQKEFAVDVIWSTDPSARAPDGWIELLDENRELQIQNKRPHRVAHRLRPR